RTVICLGRMETNSLALNGSGPAAAVCRRKPARRSLITSWVLIWMSTERGEGRSFAGLTLVLALGPRAWWRDPVCSSTERDSVLAREDTMIDSPRATAVGSRLHIERKP